MKKIEIKIGGKSYPLAFRMGAFLRFKEITGKDAGDDMDLTGSVTLIYCAIKCGCVYDKIDFDMSLMEFADAISPEDITRINQEVTESKKKTTNPKAK